MKNKIYINTLTQSKRATVIAARVEGASINATCGMTGVAKHPILKERTGKRMDVEGD